LLLTDDESNIILELSLALHLLNRKLLDDNMINTCVSKRKEVKWRDRGEHRDEEVVCGLSN
jgi:hypothetical protein